MRPIRPGAPARRRRSPVRRLAAAAVCVLAAVCGTVVAAAPAEAYTSSTDVVFVHGYGGCTDATAYFGMPILAQFNEQHQSLAGLHSLAYYRCDTDGVRIAGFSKAGENATAVGTVTQDTDIRTLAAQLAWYLYRTYTAKGRAVDLVGHSMGGLIIAYALQRVAAHDANYPAKLVVPSVVTFSTPWTGLASSCTTTQCTQLQPGSSFLTKLLADGAPQESGGTVWTSVGSSAGCDVVPGAQAGALPKLSFVIDYSSPCYAHLTYLYDLSNATDARGTINGFPFTGGMHSIALLQHQLT